MQTGHLHSWGARHFGFVVYDQTNGPTDITEGDGIMQTKDDIVRRVLAALERGAHIDPVLHPLAVSAAADVVTLSGEVPGIASKRRAVVAAAEVEGVRAVIDRLRVAPVAATGDGAIRDAACKWISRDVDFSNCTLRVMSSGRLEVLRDASVDPSGAIDIAVEDGVIMLSGHVISLSHKRLAGVLAWWARGCRDVDNALEIRPAEEDNDEEVVEAMRLVLETDPLVHAEQIAVGSRNFVITLNGVVSSEDERRRAELDAWFLHGVRGVVNEIEIR